MKKHIITFSIITDAIILDLLSKYFAKSYLENWDIDLIFWAKLSLAFNEWIAFSIPLTWVLQIIVSFLFIWILMHYTRKEWDFAKLIPRISLWLIIWWALWNLYERIFIWKVTDFISVIPAFPTFNLADSFIFTWVCLAIYYELGRSDSKAQ